MKNADADGMSRLPRRYDQNTDTVHNTTCKTSCFPGIFSKESVNDKLAKDDNQMDKEETKTGSEKTSTNKNTMKNNRLNSVITDIENIKTEFPGVLKAISPSINAEVSELPLIDCLTSANKLEE